MNFKGKRFQFTEYAKGCEGNRGNFAKLSDVEKFVWSKQYDNEELWRTMYSYCDIHHLDVSFGPYYFESDIVDFETNRKVVLFAVHYLNVEYDIPLEAFKFKFTNKSIWVEVIPSVMGIRPSYRLNEVFKEITLYLNQVIHQSLGISNAFDTNVYSPRQFSRVVGSYLPESQRYVIELTYNEVASYPFLKILNMAKYRKKVTYPPNQDFYEQDGAKALFEHYRKLVWEKNCRYRENRFRTSDMAERRLCIASMEQNGVGTGNRNLALFYASMDKRDKGVKKEDWEKEVFYFMRHFDREKIDSLAQIKATIKSAYKEKYMFSCRKIRENMPEHCLCELCPFNKNKIKQENMLVIYRKQIEALQKANASVQAYKDFLMLLYYKYLSKKESYLSLKKYKDLQKAGLVSLEHEINPVYETGSYICLPLKFVKNLDGFKSELILFMTMLSSSYNGTTLNPKMKTEHYAKKLGKSERTIQRHWKTLKENGWIQEENKLLLLPVKTEEHTYVEIFEQESDPAIETDKKRQPDTLEEALDKKRQGWTFHVVLPLFTDKPPRNKTGYVNEDFRKRIRAFGQKMTVP